MTEFEAALIPYTDGNGLISPNRLPSPPPQRASDNGPLFTAQAMLLGADPYIFTDRIRACIDQRGYLHRSPDDTSDEAPDDLYGVFAALIHLDIPMWLEIPYPFYFQPGLQYMRGMASWKWWAYLLSPLMAIVLAFSNIFEDKNNTSNKLLTWSIIKGIGKKDLLCWLGGKIWSWRMQRIYGSTREIAKIYYEPGHPFVEYWKE